MSVKSPIERSYYYECSYGTYRLVYHIPLEELEKMAKQNKISEKALEDFPDGIDLDCSLPNYKEFEAIYSYHPPADPEAVRRAFFTLFSSLEVWDDFKGTGFLSANDLESLIDPVEKTLKEKGIHLVKEPLNIKKLTQQEMREARIEQSVQQNIVQNTLKELAVKEIAPSIPLTRQSLSPKMKGEHSAEFVFSKVNQRRRKK